MLEYTVHFQRGTRVGARSLRMVHVETDSAAQAVKLAKAQFPTAKADGYQIVRVDHYDTDARRTVID